MLIVHFKKELEELELDPLSIVSSLRVGKVVPVDDPAIYSSKGPVLSLIDSGRNADGPGLSREQELYRQFGE
jgi:hypothetical protein